MHAKPLWREYGEALVIAVILAMIIRTFIVQAYQIPSGSMLNTLLIGDRLLVNKFSYGVKIPFVTKRVIDVWDPAIGDIIVFPYPENPDMDFIKRIVGLPGDTLEMRDKVLYRNGVKVDEPYVRHVDKFIRKERDNFPPVTVPPNKYYVLGDNRDDSKDSRYWGFVDRDSIRGKAWRIYWSWGSAAGDAGDSGYPPTGLRWSRLGMAVH